MKRGITRRKRREFLLDDLPLLLGRGQRLRSVFKGRGGLKTREQESCGDDLLGHAESGYQAFTRESGKKWRHTAELTLISTVVQNHAEEATMDLHPAFIAVINKAQRSELVHEMTDSRPGGADHLRQVFLIDARNDCF
jgi:hypothetical protein